MKPIAIFFHGLFFLGDPPRHMPNAGCIISNQITQMINSGLWGAATEIRFGINGGGESEHVAENVIPEKATLTLHGLQSKSENLTIVMIEDWVKTHPGWNVLYLHGKGCSHAPDSDYYRNVSAPWREAMMSDLVVNWRQCVTDLETHDVACMVWLSEQGWDKSQHYAAGTFFWATSDFLAKLPSIYLRDRIRQDGIGALASRFEAEVWIGNGPRPNVKAYRNKLPF